MMKTSSQLDALPAGLRAHGARRLHSAFTLIELLAVIAIIAVLAGVFGMALGRGNSSTALPGAQSTLFSLVASARAQAILNQTTARLVVYDSPISSTDSAHCLNYLQVVYLVTPTGSTSSYWVAAGDGVALPAGVYVVPASPTAATGQSYTAVSQLLPSATPSTLTATAPAGITLANSSIYAPPSSSGGTPSTVLATPSKCYWVEFNQFGAPTAVGSGYGTLAISTGSVTSATATAPTFNNASNVRGLTLTQLGTPILLNSPSDFP